jgi:hypothetical protein
MAVVLELGDRHAVLRDPLLDIHDVALGAFYIGLRVAHLSLAVNANRLPTPPVARRGLWRPLGARA